MSAPKLEETAMKHHLKALPRDSAAWVLPLLLSAGMAVAAEPTVTAQELIDQGAQRLPADAVKTMLTAGSTVEVVAIASGRTRRWTHGADGKFVAVSHGQSGTQATGQGVWRVSDDGQYCVEIAWKNVSEQWCRAIYRHGAATYLAPNDLARNADKRYGLLQVVGQHALAATAAAPGAQPTQATTPATMRQAGKVQMIYFGGNDCPPCVAWRGVELPKLRAAEPFRQIEFTHVYKSVMSTVPAAAFLPEPIRPFKEQLDVASGHNRGSSQTAIVVNGEIFDYYYGSRSADEIVSRLTAILAGGRYPYERCLELRNGFHATRGQCVRPVPPS
jgi:Protein of unknown function (DUF995)